VHSGGAKLVCSAPPTRSWTLLASSENFTACPIGSRFRALRPILARSGCEGL
jgi:hypothetical protein